MRHFSKSANNLKVFKKVPLINIAPYLAHGPDLSKKSVADCIDQMHAACRDIGFFSLHGHNISPDLLKETVHLARKFFASPAEEKDKIHMSLKSDNYRGYQRIGDNVTNSVRDVHEAIDFYKDSDDPLHYPLNHTNLWPKYPQEFRQVYEVYINELLNLGKEIMSCIALALKLDYKYFEPYCNESFWVVRVIHYPPVYNNNNKNNNNKTDNNNNRIITDNFHYDPVYNRDYVMGCGEHQDYGCLTLINQSLEHSGLLQVKNTLGEWIPIQPIENHFVINIGDMLHLWTNGLYQSTPHRVLKFVNSDKNDNNNNNNKDKDIGRISIAFFYEPNWDTKVEPIPSINTMNPKLSSDDKNVLTNATFTVSPIQYGHHLRKKVLNNFY